MIYALQETVRPFRIKLGYSKHPLKRFATIAAALPQEVVFLGWWEGSITDERFYHEHFKEFRVEGTREWYVPDPEILEFLDLNIEGRRSTEIAS